MAEFTSIQVKKETKALLDQMKTHPRQGMAEIVEALVAAYVNQQK